MQMPARQRPTRKASWEASCSPAWYRCNSLLTIYYLGRQNPSTLGLLCHSWLHHKQWQEARCSRGCCRVGDTARCRAWHKCRNHKESSHQEKPAGRSYVPWSSSPLVLACTSGLEKKQPVKATVVNWLPNIAKSFQRIRMHPSATSQSVSRFQSLLADQATQNHPQFSGPAWPGLMRQSRRSQSLEVYQLDKFNGSNRVIEKKHAN